MWKFLKNLFKKEKLIKKMEDIMYYYDHETQVIIKEKPGKDEWDVVINTTRDLTNDDMIKILASARKRIS